LFFHFLGFRHLWMLPIFHRQLVDLSSSILLPLPHSFLGLCFWAPFSSWSRWALCRSDIHNFSVGIYAIWWHASLSCLSCDHPV
jgi:hypothetical protein